MKIGNLDIENLYVGGTEVEKAYLGTVQVWPEQTPPVGIGYLRFSCEESQTISITNYGGNAPVLQYSLDSGRTWTSWDYTPITFGNGVDVLVRGMNRNGFSSSSSIYSNFAFGSSSPVECEGNIMFLIDYTQELLTIPSNHCFYSLFKNTKISSAPNLPATGLTEGCYERLFDSCYQLAEAPELPATTLSTSCYNSMFKGCTSLTTAPELPAITLSNYCYGSMFENCEKLNYIKAKFKTTPSTTYTKDWVKGVSSNGRFIKNNGATWNVSGVDGIPEEWIVETE